MGYSWNGVCFPTAADALAAFQDDIPSSSGNAINSFTAQPTISGSGLVTWSISSRPFIAADPITTAGTTQLLTCSTESMEQWPVQSILMVVALFFAAFAGFKAGYRP